MQMAHCKQGVSVCKNKQPNGVWQSGLEAFLFSSPCWLLFSVILSFVVILFCILFQEKKGGKRLATEQERQKDRVLVFPLQDCSVIVVTFLMLIVILILIFLIIIIPITIISISIIIITIIIHFIYKALFTKPKVASHNITT